MTGVFLPRQIGSSRCEPVLLFFFEHHPNDPKCAGILVCPYALSPCGP